MKKLLALLIPTLSYAAAETDLTKGIDFTGRTNASASLLNQLVDNATLKFGKGGVLYVSGAPDVVNNHRYTNFLWLDPSTTPPTLKQWKDGSTIPSPNTISSWQSVAGSISSVTEAMLQTASVTSNKIANVSVHSDKIAVGGVGTGNLQDASVSEIKIVNLAVTSGKLAGSSVTSDKIVASAIQTTNIADLAVTSNKLALGAIYSPQLIGSGVIAGTNLANNTVTSNQIQHISVTNIPDSVIVSNKFVNNTIGTNLLRNDILMRLPSAWGTWNGAGASDPVLIAGYNLSVTRVANGHLLFAFSNAVPTTNYCAVLNSIYDDAGGTWRPISASITNKTTTGFNVKLHAYDGSALGGNISGSGGHIDVIVMGGY